MPEDQEIVQFGLYTANIHAAELKKGLYTVPLQHLPFRLLAVLLREPGRVYTREELRQELWPADTFVDFERGISTAVNKLRDALGDTASNPVFIETVGRRGYRFIAPVSAVSQATPVQALAPRTEAAVAAAPALEKPAAAAPRPARIGVLKRAVFFSFAILVIASVVLAFDWIANSAPAKITRMSPLTFSGRIERQAGIQTDGSRLFFIERNGPDWTLMQTSINGGEIVPVQTPFPQAVFGDISPDRTEVLLTRHVAYGEKYPVWIMPIQGGTPQRVGDLLVDQVTWFPDGQRLLCLNDREVFSVERDGGHRRHLFTVEAGGPWGFSWRRDGSAVRFTVTGPNESQHVWEASADGTNVHPLLPGWKEGDSCCGTWSPDGRNYVFVSRPGDLWLLHEPYDRPWRSAAKPVRLTNGPTVFSDPRFSPDGKKLFVTGLQPQAYVAGFHPESRQFARAGFPQFAFDLAYSHDGQWVLYIAPPGGTLWRSKVDGSEKLQLTGLPMAALRPRWSPDDKKILFVGRRSEQEHFTAYIVPPEGGSAEPVLEGDPIYREYPDWSPDQKRVILSVNQAEDKLGKGITLVDLATRKASLLPGSKGMTHARWSPRGDFIVAVAEDLKRIFLFDTRTQQWRQVATANLLWKFEWEPDGRGVLYQDMRDQVQTTFRIDTATGAVTRAMDCSTFIREGALRCVLEGRAPDGSLMSSVVASWANIYAFDVELP